MLKTENRRYPVRSVTIGDEVFISVTHNGKLAESVSHLSGAVTASVAEIVDFGNDVFELALDLPFNEGFRTARRMTYMLAGGVHILVRPGAGVPF